MEVMPPSMEDKLLDSFNLKNFVEASKLHLSKVYLSSMEVRLTSIISSVEVIVRSLSSMKFIYYHGTQFHFHVPHVEEKIQ